MAIVLQTGIGSTSWCIPACTLLGIIEKSWAGAEGAACSVGHERVIVREIMITNERHEVIGLFSKACFASAPLFRGALLLRRFNPRFDVAKLARDMGRLLGRFVWIFTAGRAARRAASAPCRRFAASRGLRRN